MLNAVIRFALHYRPLIVFLSLAVLLYGAYTATRLPIDVFPDLDRPRVVVMTECHGLAPEEVETMVTAPLESGLLGATGVQAVRSQSGPGLSVVNIEFDWGTNIFIARQLVQERLAHAQGSLPSGLKPTMTPISSLMGQILQIGMSRVPGPNGGMLVPVERTSYYAEIVLSRQTGELRIAFWGPRAAKGQRRTDPADWHPVTPDDTTLSITWPGQSEALVLRKQKGDKGASFVGADLRLAQFSEQARLNVRFHGRPAEAPLSQVKQNMELRGLADWIVRPRLLKVPGVAQASVMGGGRRQYQVLVDPDAMFQHGVTLEEIEAALRKNNLNATGGFTDSGGKERPIRVFGRLGMDPGRTLDELRRLPVKQTAERTVLLEQVAPRIVEAPQLQRGDSAINGRPGVLMIVLKQPATDTRLVSSQIISALEEMAATLPPDIEINHELFQMKRFIDRSIFNVGEALVIGAVLVLIVLFLFLLNFRTTFISLTAIPLSLAITALTFKLVGWLSRVELSINIMTLGGIAVAMGELVDDAIVDVENIFRRLRDNNASPQPRPALAVIYEASVEIRSAIVFGTLMVILVFLPLFALPGMEGRLFVPLAIAYIVSIFASLLVSLTVTPVLSYYLLPQSRATHRRADSPLLRGLKWGAAHLVRFSMAYPGRILLASWLLVIVAFWHLTRLGSDFLPPFDEGSVQVNLTLPPGASLDASREMGRVVDDFFNTLRKSPQNPDGPILHFVRVIGRAELEEHVEPVSNTECVLNMNPHSKLSRSETLKLILTGLKGNAEKPGLVPYADVETEQPLAHLISHMLTGVNAQVAVKVYGDDLDVLRSLAQKIKNTMARVEGVTPPVIEAQQAVEELHIRLKPEELAQRGMDREHVAHFVQLALQGEVISQVIEGQRRIDLVLRLDEPFRTNYPDLSRLRIDVPDKGTTVLLGDIADVGPGQSPNLIHRENARRRLVIRCNASGRDLGSVAADIERALREQVVLPPGYFVELGGQFQTQREATLVIGLLSLVAAIGMFMILYMLYPSARIVLQVLNALPMAFIGGVLALVLTGQTVTVAALVGFISLGGIAVRNGILLVTHYYHLMEHEGEVFSPALILRGSLERLAPVLMTALTAGIALIPLVVGGHQPGREILYPVATVILGGLITSTLCEFLIHPGLFWRFSGQAHGLRSAGHDLFSERKS